jgi:hypothetical protein
MTPEEELLDTIEQLRKAKFPELPSELVKLIVNAERDFTDNRQEAYRRISSAIDEHLAKTQSSTSAGN